MTEATRRKPRVYLAGPMRGIQWHNFPEFDVTRDAMLFQGWDVVSPADLDRAAGYDATRLSETFDWTTVPPDFDLELAMLRDLEALETCDAIVLMCGWQNSIGAQRELAEARRLGLREFDLEKQTYPCAAVMMPQDSAFLSHADATALAKQLAAPTEGAYPTPIGETRTTDPQTGGQKGDKLARFDLIPSTPLWELAEHYGRGARKYDDNQWRKGYKWHLSFAACLRHLWAFWRGEDIDPETGSKHVIAAAWHCLTLAEFMTTCRTHDDRTTQVTP